jgi:hypothetical protein
MKALDPLLAPALAMAERPVISSRRFAEDSAARLTTELERLGQQLARGVRDPAGQLQHVCEALAVLIISLCAYARGVVPKVASEKPNLTVIDTGKSNAP